ncbi:hypothetical protein [Streptomyces sp. NPDC058457]
MARAPVRQISAALADGPDREAHAFAALDVRDRVRMHGTAA